jgi:hypothetical protein
MFIPLESQRLILSGGLLTLVDLTVASCGSDDPGAMWVDFDNFAFYKCGGLARRWKELVVLEKDLRGLIEKANETSTGAVVGSITYRSDYKGVLPEEKLLQRVAGEKKCVVTPDYQSDHTIQ